MTEPNIVILCPRRGGIADRDRLWSYVHAWWREHFPQWPIHTGASPEGPFNRGAAINDAARKAGDWDLAIIIDSDAICAPDQVEAAVEKARETGRMCFPYTRYRGLQAEMTERILNGYNGDWGIRHTRPNMNDHVSSVQVVPRALWTKVGGFDERFVGWGYDDSVFAHTCRVLGGGYDRIPGTVWHLWHKPSPETRSGSRRLHASKLLATRLFEILSPGEMEAEVAGYWRGREPWPVVLTHGRRDCVERCIRSFFEQRGGYSINRAGLIVDDSGDPDYQAWLRLNFPDWTVIGGKHLGFAGNVRRAWDAALANGSEWVFWIEDDFVFTEEIPFEDMQRVMTANPHLTQVVLKRQAWFPKEIAAGGIVEMNPDAYAEKTDGTSTWLEHQLGHWTNPHLVRREFLATHEWPNVPNSERVFSDKTMRGDLRSAFWGGFDSPPMVTHDGERSGDGY